MRASALFEIRHSQEAQLTTATMYIHKLERQDLGSTLTCSAFNNISSAQHTSVTLDLNLKPVGVKIRQLQAPISSGLPVEVVCEVSHRNRPSRNFVDELNWSSKGRMVVQRERSHSFLGVRLTASGTCDLVDGSFPTESNVRVYVERWQRLHLRGYLHAYSERSHFQLGVPRNQPQHGLGFRGRRHLANKCTM